MGLPYLRALAALTAAQDSWQHRGLKRPKRRDDRNGRLFPRCGLAGGRVAAGAWCLDFLGHTTPMIHDLFEKTGTMKRMGWQAHLLISSL